MDMVKVVLTQDEERDMRSDLHSWLVYDKKLCCETEVLGCFDLGEEHPLIDGFLHDNTALVHKSMPDTELDKVARLLGEAGMADDAIALLVASGGKLSPENAARAVCSSLVGECRKPAWLEDFVASLDVPTRKLLKEVLQ